MSVRVAGRDSPLRIVHVSRSDLVGGAARATWRLHQSLVGAGLDSRMIVMDKHSDDPRVVAYRPARRVHRLLRRWLHPHIQRWARLPDGKTGSLNLVPSGIIDAARTMAPDVIHLHWLGAETASIGEIGRICGPVAWTLHDMWAFSGASHVEADVESSVWRAGETAPGDWRERLTWLRKARSWRDAPFEFITPSRWLAGLLARSALFPGRQATVIPNTLDVERFKPCDQTLSRERLGLPVGRPVIGFGAVGGLQDPNKGGNMLLRALRQLPDAVLQRRPVLCIFGESRPEQVPDSPVELVWLGYIQDERLMPLVYSAIDVMTVPSVLESFGQTGAEAQSCGCPVVTFAASGMSELVEPQRTGYLAAAGSSESLAEGIAWVLEYPDRRLALGAEARRRAVSLWSFAGVAAAHRVLYERLVSGVSAAVR